MKRKHAAAALEARIRDLRIIEALITTQIGYLEDLHEDIALGKHE